MSGAAVRVPPDDVHNRALVANVHPRGWVNPQPVDRYNLVVIGAGTAGLVTAAGAAGLGARVALIEKHLMGGDCLNVGCVPSKALIRSARAAAEARRAGEFGVRVPGDVDVDFTRVMERMRRLRAAISPHDSARRFRELGIDVFLGEGRFTSGKTLEVDGCRLRFRRACIATGGRPAHPPVPGLAEAGFLTNETVFSLTELPRRLAVIGGGPIGCELAQAFARFGSEVDLVHAHARLLPKDDPDAAAVLASALERDGVRLHLESRLARVTLRDGAKVLHLDGGGATAEIAADEILVGAGRQPNVETLNLEAAGVDYDPKAGVRVNDLLQTTNRRIYAAGDVCSRHKFTHIADFQARIVIRNALFPRLPLVGGARVSRLVVPWCTYTSPEIAHVGLLPHEAATRGLAIDTFTQDLARVDRAVLDGAADGFVRVHVKAGSDRIVGATIVARHAGELISELTAAIVGGLGLRSLGRTIHPYPTQAEAIRQVADQYNRARLTPGVRRLLERWFRWRR